MRATVTPSPIRKGKRRLLTSCAITAGMMALAYGGAALAQVNGTGTFVSGNPANTIVNSPGTNTTTVNTTGAQTIINWTPSTAPVGGVIDFLPSGENLNFRGDFTGYTVLNRFVSGSGASITDTIALNGAVNSYRTAAGVPDQQGGSIWFYNAGGILVGNTGVINVGSLVLTSNDIVTTGGLFDTTTGAIRFRGAAGSTNNVTVNGSIDANEVLAPGSSYVALVAPRVVQAGSVSVYGSAAYVAGEQADITINGGLFDINVLVGAEGGNVITHTGSTSGPEQGTGPTARAQRIYMVAIPKNVAVGMLVSGQVGYQDGATTAITNSDGSVVLSAGYNVTNGLINTAPVNGVGANITVNDIIFRSNVLVHASGAFLGQPLLAVPAVGGPVTALPPPQNGRFIVQGNGTFIGDTSSTLTVNANRVAGATGTLTIQSNGRGGVGGNANVNVNGGTVLAVGGLSILADAAADPTLALGTARGGTAGLSITAGGTVATNTLLLSATGTGGITGSGAGGTGTGGTASVTVSGAGSLLSANSVNLDASGFGGGLTTNASGVTTAADAGGDGQGGNALATVDSGGSLSVVNGGVALNANGFGELGNVQSGNGTGGTARVTINGDTTSYNTAFTVANAVGVGGGSFSRSPVGTFFSANGGDGRGGVAELLITSASSTLTLGGVGLAASGIGGNAGGPSENTTGGDATGGNANLTVNGNANIRFQNLSIDAHAESGSATSASGRTARSGNGQGGNINVLATGSSRLTVTDGANLDASGNALTGENVGNGAGGNINVTAVSGGTLDFGSGLFASAFGGIISGSLPGTAGTATGGNIDLLADLSGTITVDNYGLNARASAANAATSNGAAQGGSITMTALNGGLIASRNRLGVDSFDVSAQTGYSQTGASATGGDVTIFANEASIALSAPVISAGGVAGGALARGGPRVMGTGGTVVIRTGFGSDSSMNFGSLSVDANGRTQAFTEGSGGEVFEPSGDGQGGSISVEANGADLTISGSTTLRADGYGGLGGASATGRGGIVNFSQIGGNVVVGDIRLSADGYGGSIAGQSGDGFGGSASASFTGGTFTGDDFRVSASGFGGGAFSGDDFDPANPFAAGNGGNGQGGNASISIAGDAVVDVAVLTATANGFGASGGDFYNYNGSPGPGGNGGNGRGGFATINLTSGELNADAVVADAGGTGGNGGGTYLSSTSSGTSTGFGVGGNGGNGEGGSAMIELAGTALDISESVTSYSGARGGDGGGFPTSTSSGFPTRASVGGNGGGATGGLAQVIIDNYDAGILSIVLDTSSFGGNGGDGLDGNGGRGGDAYGGTARVEAIGADASVIVSQANFEVSAVGGNGGSAFTDDASRPAIGGRGGDGGFGTGGDIQIAATDGGIVQLGVGRTGGGLFGSTGTGGDAGRGADNPNSVTQPGPDGILGTRDDIVPRGGDGGIGGGGTGGTVSLLAYGGTITSGGAPIGISVNGVSGQGGDGGIGSGGGGSCCSAFLDFGGRVLFETRNTAGGTGQITLGDTAINANGGGAGRIEMRSVGNITMASLTAEALGFAFSTNNNVDEVGQGIFFAPTGGTISTGGDLTLRTGGSIGVFAEGSGRMNAGGNMILEASDQIDLRHGDRGDAANPTLFAAGDLTIVAGNTLTGAAGTILSADGTLTLANSTPDGSITVDRLDGDDIAITSDGRVNVEHAEAAGDFTATAGSFRTGLNSIITGGNIDITSVGAVDLGNSNAGGYVDVEGQSITFANIVSGFYVQLNATGTATGAEGIDGGTITSDSSTFLNANSIAIDSIDSGGSLSAFASGGNVAIGEAIARSGIGISAQGDITGSYAGGADIFLSAGGDITASASAIGEGGSSSSGPPTAAGLYVDADGDVTLSNSEASGMFGVNAGGSVTINGGTAGEDMLVLAGTTADLSAISVGDDLDVRAPGTIRVTGASATGDGPDGLQLIYTGNGFTINQGEGNSTLDGADITLISSGGSISASGLSAGDDIFLSAATIALNGATTLGLGVTGGESNISTTGGDTTVSGLDAFDDVLINSTGTANISSPIAAGRNVSIEANDVTLASIFLPNNEVVDTVTAGGNINVTSANDITGGAFTAGGSLTLTADGAIGITQAVSGEDAEMTLTGATGIAANLLRSRGAMTLNSDGGAVQVNSLASRDAVTVSADSLDIGTNGPVEFANIATDVGGARIRANNRLIIDNATIAGAASLSDTGEHIIIRNLTAASVDIDANEMLSMTNVTATNDLTAEAGTTIFIDGTVTGQNISLASADIDLVATGRVGTAGITQALSVQNNDNQNQTFVGGTGMRNGFHIDAAELTRLYGSAIEIFAPEVQVIQPASVGSSAPPDVIVDTFTMTGGGPNAQGVPSNLGANGSLTIRTPGKMRVIGNVQLTGLSDTNGLNLVADDALEVILGQGTVRLLGANNAPGGVLTMESDDIIVATSQAITDVANAATMAAINTRLGQNDGMVLDEGALFARRIAFDVDGGVYVQNSGAGTDFGQRRGLTFGDGGLDVTTEGPSRIVLNGVYVGPNGQIVGLDVIPRLTIGGSSVPTGGTTGSLGFDPESTLNGCFIANTGACTTVTIEIDRMFPVQDVIEDQDGDGDDDEGDGTSLPTALITMRDLDPLSGEPLLDDPVTGAGNDDLWTPTTDTQQP